jgi:Ca-activated chloride channel family protein
MSPGPGAVAVRQRHLRHGLPAALVLGAGLLCAQPAGLSLRFTSPAAGTFVAGKVVLGAAIDPPARADEVASLTFFADGQAVCTLATPPWSCDWDAGPDVEPRTLRVVAVTRDGERLSRTIRTKGVGQYADRVEVDAVQLTVVVTDRDGAFVPSLPQSAFTVFEDGRPQAIASFASANIPLDLVAAIDVSQSMTDAIADTRRAAITFLEALSPSSEVTLLAFNDNVFPLARRATDAAARTRAVAKLAPWGGTALYDVIIRSIDLLGARPGRRALVLFSDGEDQSSRATMEAAIERVEASDVTMYAVGLGRATRVGSLRALLERLTTLSGGRGLFTDRSDELEAAFAAILQDLSNQYLIGYQPTNQKRDGAWRTLRVEVSGGPYNVRARQGYRLLPRKR